MRFTRVGVNDVQRKVVFSWFYYTLQTPTQITIQWSKPSKAPQIYDEDADIFSEIQLMQSEIALTLT